MEAKSAREQLRQAGLKVTLPRVAVLRMLASSRRPVSHTEVVAELGSDEWSASTLYRNLRKLVEVGLAATQRADGIDRYELATTTAGHPHTHPHFVCRTCGQVSCLPEAKVARRTGDDANWGTAIRAADVQFVGVCPTCTNAEA